MPRQKFGDEILNDRKSNGTKCKRYEMSDENYKKEKQIRGHNASG